MNINTDLALEAREFAGNNIDGAEVTEKSFDGMHVTRINIINCNFQFISNNKPSFPPFAGKWREKQTSVASGMPCLGGFLMRLA